MRVGIVGAGIGGLTLAHALRRRGIDVTVLERDGSLATTAGYRLHLNPQAIAALGRGLPPEMMTALRASGSGAESFSGFAVLDHHGRRRLRIPMDDDADLLMIGRQPLRTILAEGLRDAVIWNTTVSSITETADRVRVRVDGTADMDFDVVVGSDGSRSRVAPCVTGRPAARPAGVTAIAGRVPLEREAAPRSRLNCDEVSSSRSVRGGQACFSPSICRERDRPPSVLAQNRLTSCGPSPLNSTGSPPIRRHSTRWDSSTKLTICFVAGPADTTPCWLHPRPDGRPLSRFHCPRPWPRGTPRA